MTEITTPHFRPQIAEINRPPPPDPEEEAAKLALAEERWATGRQKFPGIEPKTLARVKECARLKVAGNKWAVIADHVGVALSTAKHYPIQHKREWAEAWDEALAEVRPQAAAEGMYTLRDLMRPVKPVYDKFGEPMMDEETGRALMVARDEKVREAAAFATMNYIAKIEPKNINVTGQVQHQHLVLTELLYAANHGGFALDSNREKLIQVFNGKGEAE